MFAEWFEPSEWTLNRALHAAVGIILAVVSVEVMPDALEGAVAWQLSLTFLLGGAAYLLVEMGIESWQN